MRRPLRNLLGLTLSTALLLGLTAALPAAAQNQAEAQIPAQAHTPSSLAPVYELPAQCLRLQAVGRGWLGTHLGGYWEQSTEAAAHPFWLAPAGLSRWTIRDSAGSWLFKSVFSTVMKGATYGKEADWTLRRTPAGTYLIQHTFSGSGIYFNGIGGTVTGGAGQEFTLTPATGCYQPLTIDQAITGRSQLPAMQGLADGHTHLTAAIAFGGKFKCGAPFSPGGPETALAACASHSSVAPGGVFNAAISGTDLPPLNAGGWPDFATWPRSNQLLFEQTYYSGIERAWQAGLRVLNTYLVSNRVICSIYPLGNGSGCNEMDTVWRQVDYLYEMQDYIDAVAGGPGKGFFRIATSPEQIRAINADGKLAVTMGVEVSEIFGCSAWNDIPRCTKKDIIAGLDALRDKGIMRLYPIHKFDNAMGGTRFDPGTQGVIINTGQFLDTGHWWQAEKCQGPSDNEIGITDADAAKVLSLGYKLPLGTTFPVYPPGPLCNVRGLSELGEFTIRAMMDRGMIIVADHMSIKTVQRVLEIAEENKYPGLVSDHTWSDPTIVQRLLALGGFVSAYAFDSHNADPANTASWASFPTAWRQIRAGAHGDKLTGFAFGSDSNGLAPQPKTPSGASSPLEYPFTVNGVRFGKSQWANKVWDYNEVGVANYGLYADWYAHMLHNAGSDAAALSKDMLKGTKAFVEHWERTRAAATG